MKRIIKLTIILSLLVQVCYAQKSIETESEYKAYYDSLVYRLKLVRKDSCCYMGKPFSELIKHLDKCGLKITSVLITDFDSEKAFPQHVYGIDIEFRSKEARDLAWRYKLRTPGMSIRFEESKPYEKAKSLFGDNTRTVSFGGDFTKEVEAFFSDAVIKAVLFSSMDGKLYWSTAQRRLPLTKEEAKTLSPVKDE